MATEPIDYYTPPPPDPGIEKDRRIMKQKLLVALCTLAVAAACIGIARHRGFKAMLKEGCGETLRSLGTTMILYAQDNGGSLPPDLGTVMATQPINGYTLVCPASADVPPASSQEIPLPGHCSFVYVGTDLTILSDSNCVAALEDPANHDLEGGNVLFMDGHVDYLAMPDLMQCFNDLQTGRNPPTLPSSMTVSQAKKDYEKNWKSLMPQLKTGVWRIPSTQPATRP